MAPLVGLSLSAVTACFLWYRSRQRRLRTEFERSHLERHADQLELAVAERTAESVEGERRLRLVFENAPACLWHEDMSGIKREIDRLTQAGVEDFRHYFETHPDAVAECVKLITVLDVNRAAVELHHAESKDELINSLTRTFSENSFDVFREQLIALANGALSFESDAELQTLDGKKVFVLLRMFVNPDSANWSSVFVAITDITDRKGAEEALRDSEMRSRTLLEGSPVCNKVIDLDFRLQYMSAAGQTALKIADITQFYGQTYPPEFYPESTRIPFVEQLELAKTGVICSVESPLLDMEGGEVWYHTTFVPARNDEGKIQYIIASSVNITDRKQAEQALRESDERLDLAVRGTSDGIWDANLDAGKEYWSPRFKELLGYGEDEIESTFDQFLALLHSEDKEGVSEAIRLHLEENQPLYLTSDCKPQRFTVESKRCCSGPRAGTTTRERQTVRPLVSETET